PEIKEIKYDAKFLGFKESQISQSAKSKKSLKNGKQYINLENINLIDDEINQPFVSIHLAFYNEEFVAERVIESCLNQDYNNYEIIIADDSTDKTPQILKKYQKNKKIKIIRRDNREGFKGGALKEAIKQTDPQAEHVIVFDADFVPPPGTIKQFLREFYKQNNSSLRLDEEKNLAAVQGYQWHILNKDENFVTSGVRFGFAGGYMIERTAQQYFGAMKMIAGSVFMIRRDVLEKYTWQMEDGYTSIVEDWNLTIRMYIDGWKIGYTPDIKVPAECVNSLNRLARKQIRWAEGHTWNVKKYFWKVMFSPNMTLMEKLEFLHYAPFYMQAFFFILGTVGWLLGELVFHIKVPGWTQTLGWSLVFTNLMALPVMCISGLVLERGEDRDYNFLPFLTYIYYVIPHLAYASIKGLFAPFEGGWVRTKKTGSVTDAVMESQMTGSEDEKLKKNVELLEHDLDKTAERLAKEHGMYKYEKQDTETLEEKGRIWMELKRVPRLGMTIILIMAILLGSLGYLASGEIIQANPDILYLNHPQYLSFFSATNPQQVAIGRSNPSYSWYSDICPTGTDDGGISSGTYSSRLVLAQKPEHDKVYSFSVGHVNSSGGDYQYLASTTMTINQSTPSVINFNIGNAPAVVCTTADPRKLIYTAAYEYSVENCDPDSVCDEINCDDELACATEQKKSSEENIESAKANHLPYIEVAQAAPMNNKEAPTEQIESMSTSITSCSATSTEGGDVPLCPPPNCDEDTLKGYHIQFNSSSYDSSLDQTTFNYTITGVDASYALSNNIFELCLGSNVVSYTPSYGVEIGTDPKTGIYGIKWEIELEPDESRDYSFTLEGKKCEACVRASVKAGRYFEIGEITGPSCEFCPGEDIEMTVENTCNGIEINWTEYDEQYITGYKLLRSITDPDLTYPEDGYYKYITPGSTTHYTDTAVTQGQGYYYRIGAYYNGTILSYSNTEYIVADTLCNHPVLPLLECVDDHGDGTYTAHFGYENQNSHTVNIPIGWKNKFIPDPIDRGQPTDFLPGLHEDVFTVDFNGSNLKWQVKGPDGVYRYVIANSESEQCPTEHCCCDDLVIEYNNGISLLSTPCIIVPEAALLLGLPSLFGLWYARRKKKKKNKK
ncbi:glycosyltransferase family 2 protein, partial [Patescibacteria group bacterium]|nr:glycosyltransferase family 2 protein [Patescibacteria group bacterium]